MKHPEASESEDKKTCMKHDLWHFMVWVPAIDYVGRQLCAASPRRIRTRNAFPTFSSNNGQLKVFRCSLTKWKASINFSHRTSSLVRSSFRNAEQQEAPLSSAPTHRLLDVNNPCHARWHWRDKEVEKRCSGEATNQIFHSFILV